MADGDGGVAVEAVLNHVAVARFEHMQGEYGAGEGNAVRDGEYTNLSHGWPPERVWASVTLWQSLFIP